VTDDRGQRTSLEIEEVDREGDKEREYCNSESRGTELWTRQERKEEY
jgi:hypothetical protein